MNEKILHNIGECAPNRCASIFLKQKDAAAALGVSQDVLRKWNCPRIYIGEARTGKSRRIRYCLNDVHAWLLANRDANNNPAGTQTNGNDR